MNRTLFYFITFFVTFLATLLISTSSIANTGSRLLASGGVSSVEGAAGGGITPWALIAGYGSNEEINATANIQHLQAGEYQLHSYGAAVGFYDRFEFSLQQQNLDVSSATMTNVFNFLSNGPTPALIAPSTQIEQTIIGGKLKVYGDALFSENPYIPQVSVGFQYKKNQSFDSSLALYDGAVPIPNTGIPALLGATQDSGIDYYISASNVLLGAFDGNNVLYNLTARLSKANTLGLLGFESADDNSYALEMAASFAVFTGRHTLIGMEIRQQTDRLSGLAKADTISDFFVSYLPSKEWSITAALVNLGNLPLQPKSKGFYLSFTANY